MAPYRFSKRPRRYGSIPISLSGCDTEDSHGTVLVAQDKKYRMAASILKVAVKSKLVAS
jgi:hypothetical protein